MIKLMIEIELENMNQVIDNMENMKLRLDSELESGVTKEIEGIIIKSAQPYVPYKTGKLEKSAKGLGMWKDGEYVVEVKWSAMSKPNPKTGEPARNYAFTQEVDPYFHHVKPDVGSRVSALYAKRGTEASIDKILNVIMKYLGEVMNGKRGG